MISCTEFIYSYSELFKFIEKKGGKDAIRTIMSKKGSALALKKTA